VLKMVIVRRDRAEQRLAAIDDATHQIGNLPPLAVQHFPKEQTGHVVA
jgi:hypothetical protein